MNYVLAFLLFFTTASGLFSSTPPVVSLRDEIGQMLLMGFDGKHINAASPIVTMIEENNIGGVILFDYNNNAHTYDKNIESPQQVARLTDDLQSFAAAGQKRYQRPLLPLLISVDYEGGKVNRLGEQYGFPPTFSAADVGQKKLEEAAVIAGNMADTLQQLGFNLNFAPVLDVNVNPDNPIIAKKDRSFSTDARSVALYAGVYARQFLQKHIQCVYKHFPGHGSAVGDSHLGFVDVTNTWREDELEPYTILLQESSTCGMVMSAHVVNRRLDATGLPATLSYEMLTGLLREQLHFSGVIITDDMQMKAISSQYGLAESVTLAINAGADMLIFGNTLPGENVTANELITLIERKVLSGEIPRSRIDEAYQRILILKTGLLSSSS